MVINAQQNLAYSGFLLFGKLFNVLSLCKLERSRVSETNGKTQSVSQRVDSFLQDKVIPVKTSKGKK